MTNNKTSDTKSWMAKERARAEKEKGAMRARQHKAYVESQAQAQRIGAAKKKKAIEDLVAHKKAKAKATVERRQAAKDLAKADALTQARKDKKNKKKTKKVRKTTHQKIKKARTAAQAFKNIFG